MKIQFPDHRQEGICGRNRVKLIYFCTLLTLNLPCSQQMNGKGKNRKFKCRAITDTTMEMALFFFFIINILVVCFFFVFCLLFLECASKKVEVIYYRDLTSDLIIFLIGIEIKTRNVIREVQQMPSQITGWHQHWIGMTQTRRLLCMSQRYSMDLIRRQNSQGIDHLLESINW